MKKEFSILYVDDEESNLRIFKDTFRREYNVFTALSATEGLEILNNNTINLILSDQRMPEMSGVEFLKQTLETHPKPNRILITGYSDFEAIEDAINKAHIFQYVQKPWSKNELLDIIKSALRIYHLENENIKQKQELIEAKQKAETSNLLITKFLQNMSHEIRTPMNAIMGFSQLLDSPTVSVEKQKEFIKIINNSSTQLLNIIEDILEISKLETLQTKVSETKVCLNNLLTEIYNEFNDKLETNNISFILEKGLPDEESMIITDEFKLKKIISNLLDNSLKFTTDGYIKVYYKQNGNNIDILIEDTGVGITEENREIIFNRFSRFEKKGSNTFIGGLGLGLPIAKEYTELIRGSLQLMPKEDQKTTFVVSIPYKSGEIDNQKQSTEVEKSEDKKTILIVESHEVNWIYLKILFNSLNYPLTLIRAVNEREAINVCECNPDLDLVIIDIKDVKKDTYRSAKIFKDFNKNITVVAQLTDSEPKKTEIVKEYGYDEYISKPIQKEVIEKIVTKYLVNN